MNPSDIQRSFEERQGAVNELQTLVDEVDGAEFSGEQEQTFQRLNDQIDGLDTKIRTGLEHLNREKESAEALEDFRSYNNLTAPAGEVAVEKTDDNEMFRQLLRGEIRGFTSGFEARDLSGGSATAGGNLITDVLYDRVVEKFTEEGVALQAGATLLQTESGEDMLIPTVTSYSSGALVASLGTIGESDPAFGQSTLSTYKYAAITDVASELAEDNGVGNFNVLNFVADQGGAAVGRALSAGWSTGTGSSQPQGFVNCTAGKTAASATAITANELIDLQHSIINPYRQGASWVMKDSTVAAIRKLVDGNSNYLWQSGLRAGNPDELLGHPVYADPNMDAIATGKKTVVFGNFERGYFARIAGGVRVESTNADKWTTDAISVRFITRGGGCIVDTNALRHLVQA